MGKSLVKRGHDWIETANPVERAEIFGRLDGICDAINIVANSQTVEIALERLRQLEERYCDQYEGRRPDLT